MTFSFLEEFCPTHIYCIASVPLGLWTFLSFKVPTQHFNLIEVCTFVAHSNDLILFFFNYSLVCLGSLPRYMTLFGTNFTCWTDNLTFNSTILWLWSLWSTQCKEHRSSGCNTSSNNPRLYHPTTGVKCLDWCIWFSPNVVQCIMVRHLHFAPLSKGHCSRVFLVLFKCNFANLIWAAGIFFERRGFLLQFFQTAEPCRVWHAALGLLAVSLSIAWIWPRGQFAGSSTLAKSLHISNLSKSGLLAFIEVLTLIDDQSIKCIWFTAHGFYLPSLFL